MNSIGATFSLALQHHQAGNLDVAEQLYRQVLQGEPDHANAHHLLGALAYQKGRFDDAVESIRRAIALNAKAAGYHSNLGLALQSLGRLEEAQAAFQEAVRIEPNAPVALSNLANAELRLGKRDPALAHYRQALRLNRHMIDAHCGLAAALGQSGDIDDAVAQYRQVLELDGNNIEAHNNLGLLLQKQDKLEQAISHFQAALRLHTNHAEAYNNLANALMAQGRTEEALPHWQRALALRPDFADAHSNLANALKDLGQLADAAAHCHEALRIRPDFPEGHNSLGMVLLCQGRPDEAAQCFQKALNLRAEFPQAHNNLGIAWMSLGDIDAANIEFEKALGSQPDLAQAHYDRAILWLLRGDFERGWPEYEWRWQQPRVKQRHFKQPQWDGSPLDGRTILIYAEQGLGDVLQFIRYLPLVRERGGQVIVECHPPLRKLLASAPGIDHLAALGSPLPPFDVQTALLTLPHIINTRLGTIPNAAPYLHADPQLVEHWYKELEPLGGFKIGIAWQGNTAYPADRQRSIPLRHFGKLAKVPGVRLITLQKGPGSDQLADNVELATASYQPKALDEANGAFMDTAAIVKCLDLVVASDTAVAHLAGALGVPVWLALALVPDWRWLLERDDSPWYPSMRLIRQRRYGQWEDVFDRIAAEVETHLSKRFS